MENRKPPKILPDELPQDRALRLGGERLRHAVAELPLRYAPFFGRLAALWDTPERSVEQQLLRAKNPKNWSLTFLPGVQTFEIDVGRARPGRRQRLLRLKPGARLPTHRHRGDEHVLVLEGAYTDGSGIEVRRGEEQVMPQGSQHALLILGQSPCVAALVERGVDFTDPGLRWLSKFFR